MSATRERAAAARPGKRVRMASKDPAGRALMRLSTLPAVAIGGFLAVGSLLVHADAFEPWLALPVGVVVAAVLLWWARRVPPLVRAQIGFTPWWVLGSVLVFVAAFGVVQAVFHSGQVIGTREPAASVQYGWWLAQHGGLPIGLHKQAFGDAASGLTWSAPSFASDGGAVWPRLMPGLPMLLAIGAWIGGLPAMLLVDAVLGALSVLAFAGLAGRLVGPRWAPLATITLAGSFPVMLTARAAYSAPLAQLLLLAGLCLLVDCRELRGRAARAAAGTAGLLLGLGGLVQLAAFRDLVPIVVIIGVLAARRRVQAPPLAAGLAIGVALSVAAALLLARPDLAALGGWLVPLAAVVAAAVLFAVGYAALVRHGRLGFSMPERLARVSFASMSLPRICGGVVGLLFIVLAARPLWETARGAGGADARFIAAQQRRLGVPVDPSRWYSEWSLHWVAWWVGWAVLVLAAVAAVFLTARVIAGKGGMRWLPALPILLWSAMVALWLPGTMPDHPWADRRLVPVVLPAVVLLGTWGLSWMVRTYRPQAPRWFTHGIAVIGVLAFVAPVAVATVPLVATPTQRGSVAALRELCAAIGPSSAVVVVGGAAAEYVQPVRDSCGTPAARASAGDADSVDAAVRGIESVGRQPVLLGSTKRALAAVTGASARKVVDVEMREDARTLTERPQATMPATRTAWLAFP
ncbi:MAG: hypothetical protein ACRDMV_23560 [Streptosporangiales bacterium]